MKVSGAAVLALALLAPFPAGAEEWFDAYRRGLEALGRGQGKPAVEAFERAVRLRRAPGVNVLTYGTNRLERYHPYLRLAEAHLLAGDPLAARAQLERSRALDREPPLERAGIAVLVESALQKRAATPPAAAVTDAELDAAVALVEKGEFAAGLAVLAEVTRRLEADPARGPDRARAYLYLGVAYIGLSQQERSRVALPLPSPGPGR